MRVLLVGATGFIGGHIRGQLLARGVEVLATTRRPAGPAAGSLHWARLDLRDAVTPQAWTPLLEGVDAVINAAGVLQDGLSDSTGVVHADAPRALFEACGRAGVRRVIQISAIGVDRQGLTAFSSSKLRGDQALAERDLDWVILRPSVVLGRAVYGGSALFRALASLPVVFRPPAAGLLQVVQLDDVTDTVLFFLRSDAPAKVTLELAGPERLAFEEVVSRYRRWLGWKSPRIVAMPAPLMNLAYRLGDLAGLLGWRPPVRTTTRREMVRGAVGDPAAWTEMTGIQPQTLDMALLRNPASAQERWFAGLYLLKPLVFGVLSLFWIGTGLISLGPGYRTAAALMQEAGAGALRGPGVVAGAVADIVIGMGVAVRPSARLSLYAALALSLVYLVAGTAMTPRLWADPLGPLWKVWPIVVLTLVALAILDDR